MILDAQNLSYAYQDFPLFESITLQIQKPGLYLIKGPNGSGKTTLLKILARILKPLTGKVQTKTEPRYIGHLNALHDELPLSEMLDYYAHFLRSSQDDKSHRAIKSLSLHDHLHTKIADLSYGQKRKSSLMRLFLGEASFWILDEPFQGLDQEAHSFLWSEIEALIKRQGTCIMTTHDHGDKIPIPFETFDLKNTPTLVTPAACCSKPWRRGEAGVQEKQQPVSHAELVSASLCNYKQIPSSHAEFISASFSNFDQTLKQVQGDLRSVQDDFMLRDFLDSRLPPTPRLRPTSRGNDKGESGNDKVRGEHDLESSLDKNEGKSINNKSNRGGSV